MDNYNKLPISGKWELVEPRRRENNEVAFRDGTSFVEAVRLVRDFTRHGPVFMTFDNAAILVDADMKPGDIFEAHYITASVIEGYDVEEVELREFVENMELAYIVAPAM